MIFATLLFAAVTRAAILGQYALGPDVITVLPKGGRVRVKVEVRRTNAACALDEVFTEDPENTLTFDNDGCLIRVTQSEAEETLDLIASPRCNQRFCDRGASLSLERARLTGLVR